MSKNVWLCCLVMASLVLSTSVVRAQSPAYTQTVLICTSEVCKVHDTQYVLTSSQIQIAITNSSTDGVTFTTSIKGLSDAIREVAVTGIKQLNYNLNKDELTGVIDAGQTGAISLSIRWYMSGTYTPTITTQINGETLINRVLIQVDCWDEDLAVWAQSTATGFDITATNFGRLDAGDTDVFIETEGIYLLSMTASGAESSDVYSITSNPAYYNFNGNVGKFLTLHVTVAPQTTGKVRIWIQRRDQSAYSGFNCDPSMVNNQTELTLRRWMNYLPTVQ